MNSIKESVLKNIILCLVFLAGILLGLFLWNKITIPFQNPWGIVSYLAKIKYNPTNDLIRFVVFLICPVLILLILHFLNIRKFNDICFKEYSENTTYLNPTGLTSASKKIFTSILVLFSILIAVNIPTYHSSGKFDTFHEGESLGPSISYEAGRKPYKDFLLTHGIYQDYLRSTIAFSLFGRSIGSARTLESIVKILTFILISLLLIRIYKGNYLYCFATLLILGFLYISSRFNLPQFLIILPRDITAFSFLITIPMLQSCINNKPHRINTLKFLIISFLFSFIPFAAFGYSVDRGIYLSAAYLILSPILYFVFIHRSPLRFHYLTSSFIGILSAIIMLEFLLRGGFSEFFKYTFLIMPKYRDLMSGLVYPINRIPFLMICVLIAANTYWIAFKLIQQFYLNNRKLTTSIKKFTEQYLIEFSLLILSIFFFKNALGRSDWEHVIYGSSVIYILSIYIIIKYYLHNFLLRHGFMRMFRYPLILIIIFTFSISIYQIWDRNLFTENFPFKIDDSEFIPDNYKPTISFLRNNLNNEEEFFTMTSEASWYYFIDKPCPTRFLDVWFPSPHFYQNELIESLKKSNVKFILFFNKHWANHIDGIPNFKRVPLVVNYIVKNYVPFKRINGNLILIKKSYLGNEK